MKNQSKVSESIYLHRIKSASIGVIIWASLSSLLVLLFGVFDDIRGSVISFAILENAVIILCSLFASKGKYFLFWVILFIFISDTVLAINVSTVYTTFTPVVLLIRFGVGILIIIGISSSFKVPPYSRTNESNFKEKFSSTNYDSSSEEKYKENLDDRDSEDYYYFILNIDRNASIEDIKKAYKTEINKYHPDKVEHLGDEFKEIAEKKARDLNTAYNYLINKV